MVVVAKPPVLPTGLRVSYNTPSTTRTSYSANWTAVARATSYTLKGVIDYSGTNTRASGFVSGKPIQFSGALEATGGAILHGGAEVNFNPGGTAEVVPKVGVGAGELVKYSPTVNFIEWTLGRKVGRTAERIKRGR